MLVNSLRANTRAVFAASSRISSVPRFARAIPVCTSFSRLLTTSHVLQAQRESYNGRRNDDDDERRGGGRPARRGGGGDYAKEQPRGDANATNTLFVGNLANWATEGDVQDLFAPFGECQVRMQLNGEGQNRGFAHVEFKSPDIARQVVREHSGEPLVFEDRALRLDYSDSTPRKPRPSRPAFKGEDPLLATPRRSLFIANIPYSTDAEDLRTLFSPFGEVQDIRIEYDQDGRSRGWAHVEFAQLEEAQKAVQHVQDEPMMIQLRPLYVSYAKRTRDERPARKTFKKRHEPSSTIWLGNIPPGVEENDVREFFASKADVLSVRLSRRPDRSWAFAHVDFASTEIAEDLIVQHGVQPFKLSGVQLLVDFAPAPVDLHPPSNTLYCPAFAQDEQLVRQCFGPHAENIELIEFAPSLTGGGQPPMFIRFLSVAAATEAKNALTGKEVHPGHRWYLFFARKPVNSDRKSHGSDWGGSQKNWKRSPRRSDFEIDEYE